MITDHFLRCIYLLPYGFILHIPPVFKHVFISQQDDIAWYLSDRFHFWPLMSPRLFGSWGNENILITFDNLVEMAKWVTGQNKWFMYGVEMGVGLGLGVIMQSRVETLHSVSSNSTWTRSTLPYSGLSMN